MDAFAKLSTLGSVSAVRPTESVTHDHAEPLHFSFCADVQSVGTAAFAAAVTVGSLSDAIPDESVEQDHAEPDHSSFCVEVHVGTVAFAAAETVGSLSLTHVHADPVHFK